MLTISQLPEKQRNIIVKQIEKFKANVETVSLERIPSANNIPSEGNPKWFKIADVICVFVDMKNSTRLSATRHSKTTAKTYTLFTGTAIRLFRSYGASYIDIKGDGVFALFNSNEFNEAIVSAITFKTFVEAEFFPKINNKTKVNTGVRIGIDQSTLLVSKIGLKKDSSRADIHNEVWAGKAVNTAAKLSSLSNKNEICVSDHFFKKLSSDKLLYSCACDDLKPLWGTIDLTNNEMFYFNTAYVLESRWCRKHGAEYIEQILSGN